ncbi:MAG: tRNA (N(6)-L-threonylcarbamoyladenosine(37)-C(2))-methylthiotransferase MtaB, partial [Muribaculaceae bacterium]|nr:tRNA (N(6)-L-threonylcarbamoyladenosine(37)-C(2))-methylthiotransferase MtaB [Muribaculaceae bacterium]
LQSGSDEVLRLMHRHYDTALFRERIEMIKREIPYAFIGVDVIAGARGETDEEWQKSYDFIASLDITQLHVFPYSERPNTKALNIGHVVSQAEKHRRVAELMKLSDERLEAFIAKSIGECRPVLWEQPSKGKPMHGFTDNYLRIEAEYDEGLINTITPTRILCADNDVISGKIEK